MKVLFATLLIALIGLYFESRNIEELKVRAEELDDLELGD